MGYHGGVGGCSPYQTALQASLASHWAMKLRVRDALKWGSPPPPAPSRAPSASLNGIFNRQ